ncbi:AzlD domain-containing protein [Candidatus Bipolaricaulota bacterium]|nr:AzlD domain-containing protein [Candidatus Bipolaricaulota bacterium]
MSSRTILLTFLGMAVVTYVPRMLPFVLFREVEFSPFFKDLLKNLRYAILGALIFPGIFLVQDDPTFGLIGGVVAFVLAYLRLDVIFVIGGAIGVLSLYVLLT